MAQVDDDSDNMSIVDCLSTIGEVDYMNECDVDDDEKLNLFINAFDAFDQQQTGSIDINDIGNVLRCLHLHLTQADVTEFIREIMPKTINNRIMFNDVLDRAVYCLRCQRYNTPTETDLQLAFRMLLNHVDKSNKLLTKQRFAQIMQTMGEPLNDAEIKDMLAYIPVGKNGEIDWKLYIKTLIAS